jgi:hypothetical protein
MRLALALLVLLACTEAERAPWGFDVKPEQAYRLEMQDETMIDDVVVDIERLADVRLRAVAESRATGLEMLLDRYYLSVGGGPGGAGGGSGGRTEVAISPSAFVSRAADGTELRLDAADRTPSDRSVAELLGAPISGTAVDGRGATVRSSWHSADPLLAEVEVLGWLLLGLPVLGSDEPRWNASREVPRIGRYRLGVEMPLRFERDGERITVTGFVERPEITLADDFRGAIQLELEGESRLAASGEVLESRYLLRMKFEAIDGGVIRSSHRVIIACLGCDGGVQISP